MDDGIWISPVSVIYIIIHLPVFCSRYGEPRHITAVKLPGRGDSRYRVRPTEVHQVSSTSYTSRLQGT